MYESLLYLSTIKQTQKTEKMMTIAILSKYAKATGNTLKVVGDRTPLKLFTNPATGNKELHRARYSHLNGYVSVQDVRTGNHWISYRMFPNGTLLSFSRSNWVNGATQKTWNKKYSFEKHVESTVNA